MRLSRSNTWYVNNLQFAFNRPLEKIHQKSAASENGTPTCPIPTSYLVKMLLPGSVTIFIPSSPSPPPSPHSTSCRSRPRKAGFQRPGQALRRQESLHTISCPRKHNISAAWHTLVPRGELRHGTRPYHLRS